MWEQTDELQFVKAINEDEFEVIEVVRYSDSTYSYGVSFIDIKDFNDDDLEYEIKGYYNSMAEIKRIYVNSWKQVVAEIVAENSDNTDNWFKDLESLKSDLLSRYGIKVK